MILQDAICKAFKDAEFHREYKKFTGKDPDPLMPRDMEKAIREMPRDAGDRSAKNRRGLASCAITALPRRMQSFSSEVLPLTIIFMRNSSLTPDFQIPKQAYLITGPREKLHRRAGRL